MDILGGIGLALEGFSNFFGFFGNSHSTISTGWFFGQAIADFLTWLIDFGGRIAALFA